MISEINKNVSHALAEDIHTGDLTASLVPTDKKLAANVVSKNNMVLCGTQWFEACFKALSSEIMVHWFAKDGETISTEQNICEITGSAQLLLSAERSALNFLQMLSAVSTQTQRYVEAVAGTHATIVDTRKTLPGLRLAQKYAVKCGGGTNHRMGLHDGILIKENHIIAAGGIKPVLERAQKIAPPGVWIQIEVESQQELQSALAAGAKMILLDNFNLGQLRDAVALNNRQSDDHVILEASGNIDLNNVRLVAETGVDRISIGDLTKNIKAVDLSMRFSQLND